MPITPAGSCVGPAALVCYPTFQTPLGCFFCWLCFQLGFHSQQREDGSSNVWGLPFIGSPLTWEQGNGMSRMLTDSRVTLSFMLKKQARAV